VAFNKARGSRSGNFAAQDGAKTCAANFFDPAAFSCARQRSAQALPHTKPMINLPRDEF
jgi:hypothetical protein